jgi:hypothetical protein
MGNYRLENFLLIYSGKYKNGRTSNEVELLIHQSLKDNIKRTKYINDRFLQTIFQFREFRRTHVINIYALDITKS